MPIAANPPPMNTAGVYQIRLQGQLGHTTQSAFAEQRIEQHDSETVITTALIDQAELFGLLRRIRDLGLPLISVVRLAETPCTDPQQEQQL